MPDLSALERARISRKIAQNNARIQRLESLLKGIPIATVRFADGSITDAKITELSADKIITGTIAVGVEIIVNDGVTDRILITHNEIIISKPGIDVTQTITEENKKDFIVISTVDAHKILFADFVTGGSYTHNLGRIPFYFAYAVDSTSSPTYFEGEKDSQTTTTQITNLPNPCYLLITNEGATP